MCAAQICFTCGIFMSMWMSSNPGVCCNISRTTLRKDGYAGTQIFERYYTVGDLAKTYLSLLKQRAEAVLGEPIEAVTLGRPVKFSEFPEQDRKAQETLHQAAYEVRFQSSRL